MLVYQRVSHFFIHPSWLTRTWRSSPRRRRSAAATSHQTRRPQSWRAPSGDDALFWRFFWLQEMGKHGKTHGKPMVTLKKWLKIVGAQVWEAHFLKMAIILDRCEFRGFFWADPDSQVFQSWEGKVQKNILSRFLVNGDFNLKSQQEMYERFAVGLAHCICHMVFGSAFPTLPFADFLQLWPRRPGAWKKWSATRLATRTHIFCRTGDETGSEKTGPFSGGNLQTPVCKLP